MCLTTSSPRKQDKLITSVLLCGIAGAVTKTFHSAKSCQGNWSSSLNWMKNQMSTGTSSREADSEEQKFTSKIRQAYKTKLSLRKSKWKKCHVQNQQWVIQVTTQRVTYLLHEFVKREYKKVGGFTKLGGSSISFEFVRRVCVAWRLEAFGYKDANYLTTFYLAVLFKVHFREKYFSVY